MEVISVGGAPFELLGFCELRFQTFVFKICCCVVAVAEKKVAVVRGLKKDVASNALSCARDVEDELLINFKKDRTV